MLSWPARTAGGPVSKQMLCGAAVIFHSGVSLEITFPLASAGLVQVWELFEKVTRQLDDRWGSFCILCTHSRIGVP